jgi:hypothetical protein
LREAQTPLIGGRNPELNEQKDAANVETPLLGKRPADVDQSVSAKFLLPDAKRAKNERPIQAQTPLRDQMNINQDLFNGDGAAWEKSSFASGVTSNVGSRYTQSNTGNIKQAFAAFLPQPKNQFSVTDE